MLSDERMTEIMQASADRVAAVNAAYNGEPCPKCKEQASKIAELERELEAARKDSERYKKLRGWMSSNVEDGWHEVENMGALCAYESWDVMDDYLDRLPACTLGLMSPPVGDAAIKAKESQNG